MPDIFLSYSRDDQATARRFAEGFEREGLTVWWDQSLNAGEAYDKITERALEEARAVVVLWSKHSVDSRWVRAEATQANGSGKLIPAMIEPCKRPIMFELTHTADLSNWKGDASDRSWQAFVAGVRRFVHKDVPVTAAEPRSVPGRGFSGRAIAITAIAALLIIAGGLWAVGRKGAEQASTTPVVAPAAPTEVTLAVLPFADLSSAHDQEYFSDGLTEELLNQLAQVRNLRVTARTSSFSFKGKNEDVRVIGEKLGVAHLLEGSVRKDGTHLRITAQLVNSEDGAQSWSQTYDRELSDIFALQEEVAKDVAKALSIKLDVGDLTRVQGGTTNVEAYDKYLQGRKLYLQGGVGPFQESARLLREAVALDPGFSRAWFLLGYALSGMTTGIPDSESELIQKERSAATKRVLALAPDAWWAQELRVYPLIGQRKWAEAEAAVTAAPAPSADYEANGSRLSFLESVGRAGEYIQLLERASKVDPLSLTVSADLQSALDSLEQPAQAQAEYERSMGLAGPKQRVNIFALMRVLARKDPDPATIRAGFQAIMSDEPLHMPLTHALAAKFSNREQAREAIRQAIGDPANQDRVRMAVAAMYADRFDERDLALVALRRVVIDFRTINPLWLPFKTNLRADPRFKDLLREVGLADYFRDSGGWNDFCKPVGTNDFECH